MIDIILTTDREIVKLNRRWFRKRRPTDVIAFNLSFERPSTQILSARESRSASRPVPSAVEGQARSVKDGEVYISVDTARRQARERGITLWHELLRLAVHGMLHVAGYDDTNLKDFCRMREKEWEMLVRTV